MPDERKPATSSPTLPSGVWSSSQLSQISAVEKIELDRVPDVDTSRHSVPLGEIIFDTFRRLNRAVPLLEAETDLIRSLRDAIPPLYEPRFVSVAQTNQWLADEDIVLGYADGGEAYAYPFKILNFHEMVSHQVNGRHILASYCPLCRSGIVYDRLLPGAEAPLLMGNTSALYESDMVMFDHQTGSYWNQVTGEAIIGPLTGQQLSLLPAQMMRWEQWKALYPDTLALAEDTGFGGNYQRDPFANYAQRLNVGGDFFFPVSEAGLDPRLDRAAVVLAVEADGVRRAYPLERLGDGVVHDTLGDESLVIFSEAEGLAAAAYRPHADGRSLSFVFVEGQIQDEQTGSRWDQAGRATDGPLAGARLEPLPTRSTYWFSLVANYPDIDLYLPQE